jgi:hypothetical protein
MPIKPTYRTVYRATNYPAYNAIYATTYIATHTTYDTTARLH